MFTGIIEGKGRVEFFAGGLLRLKVSGMMGTDPIRVGESIAVNGCCLTVVSIDETLRFDLSPETVERTSLGLLTKGVEVNLERAMRADGRFGGHIVQGHVDATGRILSITPNENSTVFRFEVPAGFERYLIDKGSVTVDGIALTATAIAGREFDVWVIPHTMQETTLRKRKPGDRVNMEFDVLAKYVERLIEGRAQAAAPRGNRVVRRL